MKDVPGLLLDPLGGDGIDLIIGAFVALEGLSGSLKSNTNPLRTGRPIGLPFLLVLRRKSGCSPMITGGLWGGGVVG